MKALILLLSCLGACVTPISGLLPRSPSPKDGRVESLRPTLAWEAFSAGESGMISDVTYDVKVMEVGGAIVYLREGVADCAHRLETALQPNHRYEWSVRARFRWHGERRLTQWSGVTTGLERQPLTPSPLHAALPLRTPAGGE